MDDSSSFPAGAGRRAPGGRSRGEGGGRRQDGGGGGAGDGDSLELAEAEGGGLLLPSRRVLIAVRLLDEGLLDALPKADDEGTEWAVPSLSARIAFILSMIFMRQKAKRVEGGSEERGRVSVSVLTHTGTRHSILGFALSPSAAANVRHLPI